MTLKYTINFTVEKLGKNFLKFVLEKRKMKFSIVHAKYICNLR